MCDPVTAAGLALSAGGSFLQAREANANAKRVEAAKNKAFTDNMNRNRQFAADAGSIQANNTQKQGREEFDVQKEAEAQKVQDLFNANRTQPDYNVGLTSDAPKNVVIARKDASDDAREKIDRDVANNANLQGYSGALFNSGLSQSDFSRMFGNIQDKAGANTRLLPIEMNAAANNAQKGPSLFPTLLSAAGKGLSLYGGMGGSFSNTIESPVAAGMMGPGKPITSYGLFMDKKPVDLFGYQLAGRYS